MLLPLLLSLAALADTHIGGFDSSRGGLLSLRDGAWLLNFRGRIQSGCPPFHAALSASPTLTPEYLATLDVLVFSTVTGGSDHITILTADEQAAMLQFVLRGGGVVIFADNDGVAGIGPESANGTALAPFGFTNLGTAGWPESATVTTTNRITHGPYGSVSSFETFLGGWLDTVPPIATVLARLTSNNAPALAMIPPLSLGPTSGGVVVFTDSSMIFDQFITGSDMAVALNAIAFVAPPPANSCYANCDDSQSCPILNVNDFLCFQLRFAAGDPYANCDGSTSEPTLTVNDFQCFLSAFAAGCP